MDLLTHPLDSVGSLSLESTKAKDVILQVEEVEPPPKFLDIPREIRDHIYCIIFLADGNLYPSKEQAGISEYLGLLRTNHQIYSEAVEILYGRNTFQIRSTPARESPTLLNLLCSQRRDGFRQTPKGTIVDYHQVCLARHALRKLYIPSHNIAFERLKHLFSLLKHFPNLEELRVVYSGVSWMKDMDVAFYCRLLRDRCPWIRNFVLLRRISYAEAEDISWMVGERPYSNWSIDTSDKSLKHMWRNQSGVLRQAVVVKAPQNLAE
ncbi:hypothetical protein V8E51_013409 [Hyaloscypha variabilis]